MKDINKYQLTENITVGQVKKWLATQDAESKERLIFLINHRFENRYIKHLGNIDSGFLKMAIGCLTIEAIESFKQGKKDTNGEGIDIFKSFFTSEEVDFPGFKEISRDFYKNVRCGILHQAETKNAWRILRTGNILDKSEKAINATKFVHSIEKSLKRYIKDLEVKDFNDPLWKNAIFKLKDICENCKERN